jgi:hypothetical protein
MSVGDRRLDRQDLHEVIVAVPGPLSGVEMRKVAVLQG